MHKLMCLSRVKLVKPTRKHPEVKPSPGLNLPATLLFPLAPKHNIWNIATSNNSEEVSVVAKPERTDMSDLERYMMCRELINTGLIKFSNCPETFRCWKSTYKSQVQNLGIPPMQNFDLLIRWLGLQSSACVND